MHNLRYIKCKNMCTGAKYTNFVNQLSAKYTQIVNFGSICS